MRNEFNLSVALTGGLLVSTLALTGSAFGQCSVTPPPGTITSPDGCGLVPDVNGGCNVSPAVFTDLGSIGDGAVMNVAGQMGLYIPAGATTYSSRDLDWYLVTCPAGTLQVSLSTQNAAGSAQLPNSIIWIKKNVTADPCVGDMDIGIQSTICPHVQSITSGAGTHLVVVSVPFDTTAGTTTTQACGQYLMTLSHTPLTNPICGTATDSCTTAHVGGGCNLIACCESVCNFNPLCCELGWDQSCVDSAVTTCGLFVYTCAPPAGAPANDCATASQLITIGQSGVVADNTFAGTDGPGPVVSACAAAIGKDLWYTIKAPANGALTLTLCAGGDNTTDSAIEIYGLGADPVMTSARAESMPDLYIGCVDDSCPDATGAVIVGGPSAFTLIDAVANDYYLIRIGGWYDETLGGQETADTFALTIVTSFEYVVFSTGPQHPVTAVATGALTNLGLSSGCIAAASQQRWLAQPFTVPGTGASWDISRMTVKGFAPAGVTNTTMNYVVWSRSATNAAPRAPDQLFAGSVPFPTGYTGGGDNALLASHDIDVAFNLASGDYYLTAYATNASCATVFSNFAWFISAYDGINLIDATGVYNWRSATFPTPGFVRYSGLAAYVVQTGADPNDLYNTAFDVFGSPVNTTPPCPGDFNADGVRNGADLSTLLSGWGGTGGDINGDGTTNGADLSALLSGWGACPN